MKCKITISQTTDAFGQTIYRAENTTCGGYRVWAWSLKGLEKKLDFLAANGKKIK